MDIHIPIKPPDYNLIAQWIGIGAAILMGLYAVFQTTTVEYVSCLKEDSTGDDKLHDVVRGRRNFDGSIKWIKCPRFHKRNKCKVFNNERCPLLEKKKYKRKVYVYLEGGVTYYEIKKRT